MRAKSRVLDEAVKTDVEVEIDAVEAVEAAEELGEDDVGVDVGVGVADTSVVETDEPGGRVVVIVYEVVVVDMGGIVSVEYVSPTCVAWRINLAAAVEVTGWSGFASLSDGPPNVTRAFCVEQDRLAALNRANILSAESGIEKFVLA